MPNPVLLKVRTVYRIWSTSAHFVSYTQTRQYIANSQKASTVSVTSQPMTRKRAQSISPENVKRQKRPKSSTDERRKKPVVLVPDSEEETESEGSDVSNSLELEHLTQPPAAPRKSSRIASKEKQLPVLRGSADDSEDEDESKSEARFSQLPKVKIEELTDAEVLPPALGVSTEDTFGIDKDDVELSSKPKMQLNYRQLHMKDRILCVIVEPWPNLPEVNVGTNTAPSSKEVSTTIRSAPKASSSAHAEEQEHTALPLFLPSLEEREPSVAPEYSRYGSEVPNQGQDEGDTVYDIQEETNFGMLAFSQALSNVVGDNLGALDEDDEIDGAALYGDADEIRTITL